MPRKAYFYGEQNTNGLKLEQQNKRLLTTPNEKINRNFKIDYFDDFKLFKKMKRNEKIMTSEGKSRTKMKQQSFHFQEPFLLNHDKFDHSQNLFELNSKNVKKKSKPKYTNLFQRKKSSNRQFINTA